MNPTRKMVLIVVLLCFGITASGGKPWEGNAGLPWRWWEATEGPIIPKIDDRDYGTHIPHYGTYVPSSDDSSYDDPDYIPHYGTYVPSYDDPSLDDPSSDDSYYNHPDYNYGYGRGDQ